MLEQFRTALVLAPHPDDEVLGCGGTMARLAQLGCAVHVGIVTRAEPPMFAAEFLATSRREAAAAHDLLEVTQAHYLDLPAAGLDGISHAVMNRSIGELVERIAPDVLFIPFVGDVHIDHQRVFQSAMVAARPRSRAAPRAVLAYETLSETNWHAAPITPGFQPDTYVDITATVEAKLSAFARFESQVRAFPDERSLIAIRALATMRGATVYREAAEAFMAIRQIW